MKFLKSVLLLVAMLFIAFGVYAQINDTTVAHLVQPLITKAEAKWAWLAGVLAFIVVLDTALAQIPSIKANSTFQVITGLITALFGSKTPNA